jgi:hypothetical protein
MKRITRFWSAVIIIAMLTFTVSLISCQKEQSSNNSNAASGKDATTADNSSGSTKISGAPLKVNAMTMYVKVVDANWQPPVGDATLLFDAVGHAPVVAPDGHQITLGEFNMASGWADVKCVNTGTHVVLHLSGLIPNGVYTVWTMVMNSSSNFIGVGALGAGDGSQNVFTASDGGTASLSVIMPAGSLSAFGTIGNCFSSEFEVLLATAYHMDGLTHGGVPGNEATWVFQSGFPIVGSKLMN